MRWDSPTTSDCRSRTAVWSVGFGKPNGSFHGWGLARSLRIRGRIVLVSSRGLSLVGAAMPAEVDAGGNLLAAAGTVHRALASSQRAVYRLKKHSIGG